MRHSPFLLPCYLEAIGEATAIASGRLLIEDLFPHPTTALTPLQLDHIVVTFMLCKSEHSDCRQVLAGGRGVFISVKFDLNLVALTATLMNAKQCRRQDPGFFSVMFRNKIVTKRD